MRTFWMLLSLSATLSGGALAQAPQPPAPLPAPLPLFPPDNCWNVGWNVDVSTASVDPNSTGFIGLIGANVGLHPDFGGDEPSSPYGIYGMVYVVAPGSQPLEVVGFCEGYPDQSDPGTPGRPRVIPFPSVHA
jgi:hypothetical protein